MKKLFLFITYFLLIISTIAQSPISKGVYTLNGSISYTSLSYDQSSISDNTFTFNPQFGYFFINNLYTALSLNYNYHSYGNTSSNYYGIGPALRYYFDIEQIKPFLGISFIFNKITGTNSVDVNSTEWIVSGGIDYFISKAFAIEASINYSYLNYHWDINTNTSGSIIPNNIKKINIGIGVNYFIH